MMILVDGTASLIARQASTPVRRGIRTSSRITSGAVVIASSVAVMPSAASPTTSMSMSPRQQHDQAATEELLVVDDQDADGFGPS